MGPQRWRRRFRCGQTPIKPDLTHVNTKIVGGDVAIPYSWPWQVVWCSKSQFSFFLSLSSTPEKTRIAEYPLWIPPSYALLHTENRYSHNNSLQAGCRTRSALWSAEDPSSPPDGLLPPVSFLRNVEYVSARTHTTEHTTCRTLRVRRPQRQELQGQGRSLRRG